MVDIKKKYYGEDNVMFIDCVDSKSTYNDS
jgi:hypothetical protein